MAHTTDIRLVLSQSHDDLIRPSATLLQSDIPGAIDPAITARIQSLPTELSNYIRELTLLVLTGQLITINEQWRAPQALRINSAYRNYCASVYFGTNTFDFRSISGHRTPKLSRHCTDRPDTPSLSIASTTVDLALVARLRDLPQELFDHIRDFTLQPDYSLENQHAPSTLQINSASRRICAELYYQTNAFDFSAVPADKGLDLCLEWLSHLSMDHSGDISRVIFQDPAFHHYGPLDCTKLAQYIGSDPTDKDCMFSNRHHAVHTMESFKRLHKRTSRVSNVVANWEKARGTTKCQTSQRILRMRFSRWVARTLLLKIRWFGGDGVVHDLWVPSGFRGAAQALVEAVKAEVEKAE
nr:hypothetical protein B0A51_05596 [Rachicladosporium sp. CCFEE 5018]